MSANENSLLESRISEWRTFLESRHVPEPEIASFEQGLRRHIEILQASGLTQTEAWSVSLGRIANLSPESTEFATTVDARAATTQPASTSGRMLTMPREMVVAIGLALVSAATFKIPAVFGMELFPGETESEVDPNLFYFRNLGFFVFPFLAGYFVWKHNQPAKTIIRIASCFLLAVLLANIYPFQSSGSTEILTGLHVPILLWGLVGFAYMGNDWRSVSKRMDFVRFSGELFICYVLSF